eukprot:tig00020961_g16722.t1
MADSATSVLVTNLSPAATEKVLSDFFSFCGKLVSINFLPNEGQETLKAVVAFEKGSEAQTALLLTNAQLVDRPIQVVIYDATASSAEAAPRAADAGEEGSSSGMVPPQLAAVKDKITSAMASAAVAVKSLDEKHNIVGSVKGAAQSINEKLHVKETAQAAASAVSAKAHELDEKLKLKERTTEAVQKTKEVAKDVASKALANESVQKGFSFLKSGFSAITAKAKEASAEVMTKINEKRAGGASDSSSGDVPIDPRAE